MERDDQISGGRANSFLSGRLLLQTIITTLCALCYSAGNLSVYSQQIKEPIVNSAKNEAVLNATIDIKGSAATDIKDSVFLAVMTQATPSEPQLKAFAAAPQAASATNTSTTNDPPLRYYLTGQEGQKIYVFPSDKVANQRVLAAFPPNGDAGHNVFLQSNCEVTSRIIIHRFDLEAPANNLWWTLSTLDPHGNPKSTGGDEFFITYTATDSSEPNSIANITDHHNGTYSFHFVSSPTAAYNASILQTKGALKVILEQSCGIGAMAPPLKQCWLASGAINQVYTVDNIPAPKQIHPFLRPNADGDIDFGSYDRVVMLGDSIMGQLACYDILKPRDCHCTTFRPTVHRGCQISSALNTNTTDLFRRQAHKELKKAKQIVQAKYKSNKELQAKQARREPKLAIVVGSGVWEILADNAEESGVDFKSHLEAVKGFVMALKEYHPEIKIFWKSMTAMHIHEVVNSKDEEDWMNIKRVYYMSNARARHLYQLQKDLMQDLNVTVLDLFDSYYYGAHMTKTGDGRHFQPSFNEMVLSWFYPNDAGE